MGKAEENKLLIEKYPWLLPSNKWSGKWITDCMGEDGDEGYWPGDPFQHPEYDYSYTELDAMPRGWRKAFGLQMCEELNQEIITWSEATQRQFRIMQIKEKYGSLRFYTNFSTKKLDEIINKYERLSERLCIDCGQPAKWISKGWICPWCDDCCKEDRKRNPNNYMSIKEWFDEEDEVSDDIE